MAITTTVGGGLSELSAQVEQLRNELDRRLQLPGGAADLSERMIRVEARVGLLELDGTRLRVALCARVRVVGAGVLLCAALERGSTLVGQSLLLRLACLITRSRTYAR